MSKAEKIKAEIERLKESLPWGSCASQISMECNCKNEAYNEMLKFIDSLEEEPVSNDLEEAAHFYVDTTIEHFDSKGSPCCYPAFIAGAQWQKKHLFDNRIKDYDLEEAARKIATRHSHITGDTYYANDAWFFKKGAQWQKQQDQSTIELAEDHAYLAGQEQIIDKACEWLKKNSHNYANNALGKEYLVSDFKNYMKGE